MGRDVHRVFPKIQVARMRLTYQPGDHVVFVMSKISTDPGPRAHDIHPAPNGDTYQYVVAKYWTVRRVSDNGLVELVTRRGKVHSVRLDDPRLRPARWWERWFYNDRFPDLSRLDRDSPHEVSQDSNESLEEAANLSNTRVPSEMARNS